MSGGVEPTTDTGGLPPSMLNSIAQVGGLWRAGDSYAKPQLIVESARAHDVRALRVDARDLSWLAELPDITFLHVRTDGRPPLDPIRNLGRLRGLTIEVGAVRGRIDLEAHPELRWLNIKLSGKGGVANLPGILGGHPGVRHLRLSEVPFADLTALAAAFPSVEFLGIFGADRLRGLGDLGPWRETLLGFSATFASRLRTLDGIDALRRIEYVGMAYGTLDRITPLPDVESLRYLELLVHYPSLAPLANHRGIRMAKVIMPGDENLGALRTWPLLVALSGAQWIGHPVDGIPLIEELPHDDRLRHEWDRAAHG